MKNSRTAPLLLAAPILILLLALTAAPAIGEFDGINGMKKGENSTSYLRNWGPPDLFMISYLPVKITAAKRRKVDLWVYAKHGVELIFEDGHPAREFLFDPVDGAKLLPGTDLNPKDFFVTTISPEEIKRRFGPPSKMNEKVVAGQVLTIYEYVQGGHKTFGFTNKTLTFVSAGFRPGLKNAILEPVEVNHGGDPSRILGSWKSDFGEITFITSPSNNKTIVGSLKNAPKDGRFSGKGVISLGSFDPDTGFLKFALHTQNMNGHAELLLSPQGNSLGGTLFSGNNEWDCWPWQMWR